MLKSSLLEILRTFSKQELIKFEDFVRSPYFNRKENVLKLFLEIKSNAPAFESECLGKKEVWKKLFPGKEYNYGIMKNLIFDLNQLADKFMIDQKFNIDDNKQTEYLMNSLLERELNKIYKNKYNSISLGPDLKVINANIQNISEHFDHVKKMYYIKYFYHHQYEQNYNLVELQVDRDSSLIAGFLINLFGAYNDVVGASASENSDRRENIVCEFLDLLSPGLEDIINSLMQTSEADFVYVKIYYNMYMAIKEKTEKRYLEFKRSVFDNLSLLPKVNIKAIHNCLAHAAMISTFENSDRNREILEILDSLVEQNVITEIGNDRIPLHIFTTYVSICYLFADSKKLEMFADRFVDKLDPEVKNNTTYHVKFMISFLNKSFGDALNYLSMLDIPYTFLKPAIRYYKAKCLYETDNYEMFLNEYDSLKHFLKTSKSLPEKTKKSLSNKFSLIKKLFVLRQNFDEHEYLKLKKEISEQNNLSSVWAAEKLEEIGKINIY
ncbi:MAG TPA: hypothetical protein PKC91_15065 [Ignavibacteria bacterium]|nr:hypothetical protein [Ignavibacteria bacterium]